jgi:hypothetical protein
VPESSPNIEAAADRSAEQALARVRSGSSLPASRQSEARIPLPASAASGLTPGARSVLDSAGEPLPIDVRARMEKGFDTSFEAVRVHRGAAAARSAGEVSAEAFTVGSRIVFDTGMYAPASPSGERLLAHELAHVVQQRRGGAAPRLMRQRKKKKGDGEAHKGAWVTKEPAGGCGVCYGAASDKPAAVAGMVAHSVIQAAAQTYFGAYARPEFPFRAPTDENGRLDLLVATKGGFKIAEIKPSNPRGEKRGIEDIRWYEQKLKETYPHMAVSLLDERIPVGEGLPMPDPVAKATGCMPQKLAVAPMRLGVYGYWCTPPFSELRRVCGCKPLLPPPIPVRVPEQARQPSRVPVRVYGVHPYFVDYANRLPAMKAPRGREFIVVLEAGLFAQVASEMQRRQLEHTRRVMRVDPRGRGMFQVPPVLIGGMLVAGMVVLPLLAVVLAAAIGALVAAAAVAVGAAASAAVAVAGSAVAGAASAAGGWIAGVVSAEAAAAVAVLLVARGLMSEAEAAEAVKPLVNKRIVALRDITGVPELENAKPGLEQQVDGQPYRAIIRLTTNEQDAGASDQPGREPGSQ